LLSLAKYTINAFIIAYIIIKVLTPTFRNDSIGVLFRKFL